MLPANILQTPHELAYRIIPSDEQDEDTGVSVIHPIKDLDFELRKPGVLVQAELHAGAYIQFQDPDDPAIPVVRKVMAYRPEIDCTITVNPVIPGLNGKSSNMVHGMRLEARHRPFSETAMSGSGMIS